MNFGESLRVVNASGATKYMEPEKVGESMVVVSKKGGGRLKL